MEIKERTNSNIVEVNGEKWIVAKRYKTDVETPCPMIYPSGYLTITDWNIDPESYLLDFPNDEVRSGCSCVVDGGGGCGRRKSASV